jgi:predicted nucleic acid binding AN1-type Zn finger protein
MKCIICKKQMGPLGFSCSCDPNVVFCEKHRLKEDHACPGLNEKDTIKLDKVVADKVPNRL